MSGEQIPLGLNRKTQNDRSNLVIGDCNALAAEWINRWPDWPGRIRGLIIHGEKYSGKSHLGAIWTQQSESEVLSSLKSDIDGYDSARNYILENLAPGERWPDEPLFHFLTRMTGADGSLLILAEESPARMGWSFADIPSRLAAMNTAAITAPDDDILMAVLQKQADDRGVTLDPDMIPYIIKRMERRFEVAVRIIDMLDKRTSIDKKKATLTMVRDIMDKLEPKLI